MIVPGLKQKGFIGINGTIAGKQEQYQMKRPDLQHATIMHKNPTSHLAIGHLALCALYLRQKINRLYVPSNLQEGSDPPIHEGVRVLLL